MLWYTYEYSISFVSLAHTVCCGTVTISWFLGVFWEIPPRKGSIAERRRAILCILAASFRVVESRRPGLVVETPVASYCRCLLQDDSRWSWTHPLPQLSTWFVTYLFVKKPYAISPSPKDTFFWQNFLNRWFMKCFLKSVDISRPQSDESTPPTPLFRRIMPRGRWNTKV